MSPVSRLKASRWIRLISGWKHRWFPVPPPCSRLPNAPKLNGLVQALAAGSSVSPLARSDLLARLTEADLSDQIGAANVHLRVDQVLQRISCDSSLLEVARGLPDTFDASRSWTPWHALTWYAWRFRPRSYLEISTDLGVSTAMVALNSPNTILVTFEPGRERNLGWPQFHPSRIAQALARWGCRQPMTAISGDSRRSVPRYFSRSSNRTSRLGQTPQKEFDLIFVDGSRGVPGFYQDLKNVFQRCAVGGMVVFRGMDRPEPRLPGQYCPRLHGLWERLSLRFPGFQYWKAPVGFEVGLALRLF